MIMKRAQNSEIVKRINRAYLLLHKEQSQSEVIQQLMETYDVSHIQAYRYVRQAKTNNGEIAIPESSVVFTVKLPPTLIGRIREFSRFKGISISKVVHTALEEFLAKKYDDKKGETN